MTSVDIDIPVPTLPDTQTTDLRFKKLQTVIEMEATTSYLGELVRLKKNLFLNAMQYLEIILSVGYYALLIPFSISADGESYKLVSHPVQRVLTCTFLIISTGFQLLLTNNKFLLLDDQLPNYSKLVVSTAEDALTAIVMITYLYTCIIKRHRFMNMFEDFKVNSISGTQPAKSVNRKELFTWIFCTFLFLLSLANWTCWGHIMLRSGAKTTINSFYEYSLSSKGFPCAEESISCKYGVGIIILLLELHKEITKAYVEILLWGCAMCLYNIELTTAANLINGENLVLDIKKATDVFRTINKLIKELCSAMGPITVAYYMELIPYGVILVLSYKGNYFEWHQIFMLFFKMGHILLTAESNANANNLVQEIMADNVACTPENFGKVMDLKNVIQAPIALRGMDFFTVTYQFLGSVGLAVVTYCLLAVDLQK